MSQPVKVIIDMVEDDSHWITGVAICNGHNYQFYGKVEDEKEKSSLEKGRITKLVIRDSEVCEETTSDVFWLSVVANFDRNWITKPESPEAIEVFYAVVDELERIAKYNERIYCGSKILKVIGKTKKAFTFS